MGLQDWLAGSGGDRGKEADDAVLVSGVGQTQFKPPGHHLLALWRTLSHPRLYIFLIYEIGIVIPVSQVFAGIE